MTPLPPSLPSGHVGRGLDGAARAEPGVGHRGAGSAGSAVRGGVRGDRPGGRPGQRHSRQGEDPRHGADFRLRPEVLGLRKPLSFDRA